MPQALFETLFSMAYLILTITAGILMIERGRQYPIVKKFGTMAVILGAGDAFHLVPRIIALWGAGMEANLVPLGVGKLITSITMTFFYMYLYFIWKDYFHIKDRKELDLAMWGYAFMRIAICLLPQNEWFSANPPVLFAILRNLPFLVMGFMIIMLYQESVKKSGDKTFRFLPLYVALSFLFYIPVVLMSGTVPAVGMLMVPKTLAYMLIVLIGWRYHYKIVPKEERTRIKEEKNKKDEKTSETLNEENKEADEETNKEENIEGEIDKEAADSTASDSKKDEDILDDFEEDEK